MTSLPDTPTEVAYIKGYFHALITIAIALIVYAYIV
jgi:hypothetical protein